MRITGTWRGSYRFIPFEEPGPTAIVPFRLHLTQDWLGRLRGEAQAETASGFPGIGDVRGLVRFGRLKFEWTPRLPYRIDSMGFAPVATNEPASGSAPTPERSPGMPAEFLGRLGRSGVELSGTWRVFTWMMLAESRRKVQVVLAHGDWQAQMREA